MYLHVLADVGRCSLCWLVSLIYGLWSSYAAHCPETGISEICWRRPCARMGLHVFLSLQELHLVWMSLSEPCLFFFWCNIYLVCYLRGEHTVCSKALMRINQMEGERERSNLLLCFFFFLAWWDVGFSFFFLLLEPLALGKAGKRKKKGDKEQNNTIRMLLDFFSS